MTKLLVTGSRTIMYGKLIFSILDLIKAKHGFDEIIVGDARGVDMVTLNWCLSQSPSMYYKVYKADWKKYGKAAGPIRNKEMVKDCDFGIGIWDGKSRGTKHCIGELKKAGKLVEVFTYENIS